MEQKMEHLLQIFKALSDSTRLKMVKILYAKEMCVCQLEAMFDVSQSRISQNLRILKNSGLVTERREGKWVFYKANTKLLNRILQEFEAFLQTDFAACPDLQAEYAKYINVASKMRCEQ